MASYVKRRHCFLSVSSTVKYLNAHTGVVFLRFPKKFYRLLWSALPFITCIDTHRQKIPCFLSCLHVGGRRSTARRWTPPQLLAFNFQGDLFRYINGFYSPLQEQSERVRSFWSSTTSSSSTGCCQRVKTKVRIQSLSSQPPSGGL